MGGGLQANYYFEVDENSMGIHYYILADLYVGYCATQGIDLGFWTFDFGRE